MSGVIIGGRDTAVITNVKKKDRVSREIENVLEAVGYEQTAY
jgi:hypothetical protein